MGILVDGQWRDEWYDTKKAAAPSSGRRARFATGSPPMAAPDFPPPAGAITFTVARLPMVPPHADLSQAEAARRTDIRQLRRAAHARERLGFSPPTRPAPPARAYCSMRSISAPTPLQRPRQRAGPVGQGNSAPSSATNPPRSSGCSIRRSTRSPPRDDDYYPRALRAEIDAVNARIYDTVNNGVYKAGFATTQEAYEEAVEALFETLDWLESVSSRQRYLVGRALDRGGLAAVSDAGAFRRVYYGHFKCNLRQS